MAQSIGKYDHEKSHGEDSHGTFGQGQDPHVRCRQEIPIPDRGECDPTEINAFPKTCHSRRRSRCDHSTTEPIDATVNEKLEYLKSIKIGAVVIGIIFYITNYGHDELSKRGGKIQSSFTVHHAICIIQHDHIPRSIR